MTITMMNTASTDAAVTAWVTALTRNGLRHRVSAGPAPTGPGAGPRNGNAVLCEMRDDDRAFRYDTNPTKGSDHG